MTYVLPIPGPGPISDRRPDRTGLEHLGLDRFQKTDPYHQIIIPSYHRIIISYHHHIIIASHHCIITISHHQDTVVIQTHDQKIPKFQNFTRHFLANSADRPEICDTIGGIMQWISGRSTEFAQKWLVNFQTSNGSKIARIAPMLTILGRNRSRRSVLVFQKISRHQNFRVDEKNRQTDPDWDQCETDPRPRTGPDRILVPIRRTGRT